MTYGWQHFTPTGSGGMFLLYPFATQRQYVWGCGDLRSRVMQAPSHFSCVRHTEPRQTPFTANASTRTLNKHFFSLPFNTQPFNPNHQHPVYLAFIMSSYSVSTQNATYFTFFCPNISPLTSVFSCWPSLSQCIEETHEISYLILIHPSICFCTCAVWRFPGKQVTVRLKHEKFCLWESVINCRDKMLTLWHAGYVWICPLSSQLRSLLCSARALSQTHTCLLPYRSSAFLTYLSQESSQQPAQSNRHNYNCRNNCHRDNADNNVSSDTLKLHNTRNSHRTKSNQQPLQQYRPWLQQQQQSFERFW